MKINSVFVMLFAIAFVVVSGLPTSQDLQQSLQIAVKEEPESELAYEDEAEIEEKGGKTATVLCDQPRNISSIIPSDIPTNIPINIPGISTSLDSVKNAACSAHCLSLGKVYKGGQCIDNICYCEST